MKKMFSCPYLGTQTKLCCEIYSNLWYMRIFHLAPKFENIYFFTTENILVKSWFLKTTEKQEIQTFYMEKYLNICILWYHEIRIVWFILHETLSQTLNSTKNMTRLFKEKSTVFMPMSQQMRSDFLILSLHNTHGQLKASCHYQIY